MLDSSDTTARTINATNTMIESPIRPVTRQLGLALTIAAAILCVPTPGSAGPITAPNIESFAAQQGDGFALLHDDLREWARIALASPANRLPADRGLGGDDEQFERSDRAPGRNRSVGRGAGDTSVPTAVPEPNTLILFGYGLVGAAMWTRRRIGAGRS